MDTIKELFYGNIHPSGVADCRKTKRCIDRAACASVKDLLAVFD